MKGDLNILKIKLNENYEINLKSIEEKIDSRMNSIEKNLELIITKIRK